MCTYVCTCMHVYVYTFVRIGVCKVGVCVHVYVYVFVYLCTVCGMCTVQHVHVCDCFIVLYITMC